MHEPANHQSSHFPLESALVTQIRNHALVSLRRIHDTEHDDVARLEACICADSRATNEGNPAGSLGSARFL